MSARMNFFSNNPNESRIFFEALLSPPLHLSDKVNQIISEFNALNEKMYNTTLDSIILRDGISRDDAISYFHKIKMPSILGWLIVGMIFGPHAIQLMPQSVLEAGWYKTIIMWMQCAFGKYFGARIGASITHMPNTVQVSWFDALATLWCIFGVYWYHLFNIIFCTRISANCSRYNRSSRNYQ